MKKNLIYLTLICLTSFFLKSCEVGEGDEQCPNINGPYSVNKTIKSISCQKAKAQVNIQNPKGILPHESRLTITQNSCELVATENISAENLQIPYFGEVDEDEEFTLQIENPDRIALVLNLQIAGTMYQCHFNGEIKWEGQTKEDNGLEGEIYYDLEKHPQETTPECPSTCIINMDFDAD